MSTWFSKLFGKSKSTVADSSIVDVSADFLPTTLRFHCECDIERYRTVRFGDEKEFLEQYVKSLKSDDVVWDIGASIGLYGVAAAKTASLVFSFEPDPRIAARCRENAQLNSADNMTVLEYAIGHETGSVTLFTNGINGKSPALAKNNPNDACESVTVKLESIDRLLESKVIVPASVAKIDVEGAEFNVLVGMHNVLKHIPPRTIFIEMHPNFLANFQHNVGDCREILLNAGYIEISTNIRDDEIQSIFEFRGV